MVEKKETSMIFLYWLATLCIMVFMMMVIGAATRLTDSGLSIIEWRPITGFLPPLRDAEWQRVFDLYKQTDEYLQVNADIDLARFKVIFWWEYTHRLWGRLLGLAILIPFIILMMVKKLPKNFHYHGWLLLVLIVGQGILGWWMVKSGLVGRVDVSQYRLAAHLGLAALIYAYLIWLFLGYWGGEKESSSRLKILLSAFSTGLIYMTLIAGAFVSGQHAGLVYNEWPTMGGAFIPADYWQGGGFIRNAFENPVAAQFHHRLLAYSVAVLVLICWFFLRRDNRVSWAVHFLLLAVIVQLCLGVALLWLYVPFYLALLHHITAFLLFTAVLWLWRSTVSFSY